MFQVVSNRCFSGHGILQASSKLFRNFNKTLSFLVLNVFCKKKYKELGFRVLSFAGGAPTPHTPLRLGFAQPVGGRADLILVKGDPLSDLSVLREPTWVIHSGEVRAAKAWLEADAN